MYRMELQSHPLSRTTEIQRICPGQQGIRDSEEGFGVRKFGNQGFSYGTSAGRRDLGQLVRLYCLIRFMRLKISYATLHDTRSPANTAQYSHTGFVETPRGTLL